MVASPFTTLIRRLRKTIRFAWRTKSLCRVFCVLFGHCYAQYFGEPEKCLNCARTRRHHSAFTVKGTI